MPFIFRSKSRNHSTGSALINVLIVSAILATILVTLIFTFRTMQKATNNIKYRFDADAWNEEIRALLSSPLACTNTFGGLVATVGASHLIANLRDGTPSPGAVTHAAGSVYGDRSLQLISMTLGNYVAGISATKAQMTLRNVLASVREAAGPQRVPRTVNLSLEINPADNTITSCVALAKMSDGLWQRSLANINNIFFVAPSTGGNVGIGVPEPSSRLMISKNASPLTSHPFALLHSGGADGGQNWLVMDTFGAGGGFSNYSVIVMRSARGTAAAPEALRNPSAPGSTDGDRMGVIGGSGYTGAGYSDPASYINFITAEDWTPASHGSGISFVTTPIGSVGATEKMRIEPNGDVGIGDSTPDAKLKVVGAICARANGANCAGNTPGTLYAGVTVVQSADYAEYFHAEEKLLPGEIVGLNLISGLMRRYRVGDQLVGVVSSKPGVVGNSDIREQNSVLVGLLGQVPFNRDQVKMKGRSVFTPDGKPIGFLLASGNIYINIGSTGDNLRAENHLLKTYLCKKDPSAPFCE